MADTNDFLFGWLNLLDELTYYELFGLRGAATADQVQAAFHVFCDHFHPDRHFTRTSQERDAVSTIFKRGNEAYLVLSDLALRERYDEQLATRGHGPPQRVTFSPLSKPPSSRSPNLARPLEAEVRSPSARPFARQADELLRKGDLRHAKLQLVMANHLDPGNEALERALRDVEASLARAGDSKRPK
ncbi:MAG: DnaJ domain-containing protein [Myxococcota bacterium]|nr:DnaJ domain-containing protein [Myxococcota bacterium]